MSINAPLCLEPIFIIGSPRSGTSILAWALAQHSALGTFVESDFLWDLYGHRQLENAYETAAARPDGNDWLVQHKVSRAEFLAYAGLGLNALVTSRSEKKRWIDQTPRNTLMVETLLEMFPGAFFIHILRDGRKVVNSMIHFAQLLGTGGTETFQKSGRLPDWATDFKAACKTWRSFADIAMEFCARNPKRSMTVINDELVAQPEEQFGKIFTRLGIGHEDAVAKYFRSNRINTSFPQAARETGGTRNFPNPWVKWSEDQRIIFREEAEVSMIKFGLASAAEFEGEGDVGQLQPIEGDSEDRFRKYLIERVPPGSIVSIVSRGDDRLLELHARTGWHFPRDDQGSFAGHYPADDAEAIHLIDLERARGAKYLAFPATSLWWLDHYKGIASYLVERCGQLCRNEVCALFSLSPDRDEQLRAIVERANAEDSAYEVFRDADDDFWFWLNTEGYRRAEELRRFLPSLPNEQLQARIIGSSGDRALWEAFVAYSLFKRLYERHRGPLTPNCRVLDFGCGWGRIIRYFLKDLPAKQLVGSDLASDLLQICRDTNPWCEFIQNAALPPSSLPSESFDLIYLYSVFSHLSEDMQRAWRTEFHRLLKPGGLLIATTWPRGFIERCHLLRTDPSLPCESSWRETLSKIFLDTQRHLAAYDSGQFVFAPYDRDRSPWAYSGDVPQYGEACVPRKYVEDYWTDLFELLDFIIDPAQCPQNVIVAKKTLPARQVLKS